MNEEYLEEANSAFMEAMILQRTDILKTILGELEKKKIKKEEFLNSSSPESFLHWAVKNNKVDVVRVLLKEGSHPSTLNSKNQTALSYISSSEMRQAFYEEFLSAVASSNIDVVTEFLASGLNDINSINDDPKRKNSAMHWAASFANAQMLRVLCSFPSVNINICNSEGVTPLHDAISREDVEIVQILLDFGADSSLRATSGKFENITPMSLAADKLELKDLLIQQRNKIEEERIKNESCTLVSNLIPRRELDSRFHLLWPTPSSMTSLNQEPSNISSLLSLSISPGNMSVHDIYDVWETHRQILRDTSGKMIYFDPSFPISEFNSGGTIHCTYNSHAFSNSESYRLVVRNEGIRITFSSLEGLHFAIMTLNQIFHLFKGNSIPSVLISDTPRFSLRGIVLDVNSSGCLPKLELWYSLINIWSSLKFNHIHIFFRCSKSATEWQLPYSKVNLLSIDRYCRRRYIHFVPLLEVDHNSTPEDLKDYSDCFRDILGAFDSLEFIHLGPKLSSIISTKYLRILFPAARKTSFILCANTLSSQSQNLPQNAIYMDYGLKKGSYLELESFTEEGFSVAATLGSNAWNSLTFDLSITESKVRSASEFLESCKSLGLLTAHWSSDKTLNLLSFAWPSLLLSSGLGWNPAFEYKISNDVSLTQLLSVHVFGDLELSQALMALEEVEKDLLNKDDSLDGNILWSLLYSPENVEFHSLTSEDFANLIQKIRRIQINYLKMGSSNDFQNDFKSSTPSSPLSLWENEIHLVSELALLSARIARSLLYSKTKELSPTFKTDIANRLLTIMDTYKNIWMTHYIFDGLEGSFKSLTSLFKKFLPSIK